MLLNSKNNSGIIILFFLTLSTLSIVNLTSGVPSALSWGVSEGDQFVYDVLTLQWNGTDHLPVTNEYDEDMGAVYQGNQFYARVQDLPDGVLDFEVRLDFSGTETSGGWNHEYTVPIDTTWPNDTDGPPMFAPVLPIRTESEWITLGENFNASAGFESFVTSTEFILTGNNATLNVSNLEIVWNKATGILNYYYGEFDGPEDLPMTMELEFLYFRDESQWDLYWGIDQGDLAAWRVDELNFNGTDFMPFDIGNNQNPAEERGDGYYEENYLYQGDVMVLFFNELSDLVLGDHGPQWNGSLSTPTFQTYVEFYFESKNDGPRFWYPLIPLGNDQFMGNITDQFDSIHGTTVTVTPSTFNVTMDDGVHYESIEWDLTHGLISRFIYNGEGPEGLPLSFDMGFLYYLPWGLVQPNWGINEGIQIRYNVLTAENGTNDYIVFEDDPAEYLAMYPGDLVSMSIYQISDLYTEGPGLNFSVRTSRGYEQYDNQMMMTPPGLESSMDGPPALFLAIPIKDAGWWDPVAEAYNSLGYTVTNTVDEIGFSSTGDVNITARWAKSNGLLNYYNVEMMINTYDHIQFEFERGITFYSEDISWNWGISTPYDLKYYLDDIQLNGTNYMEFGSTDVVNKGETLTVKMTQLSNLALGGPIINATMTNVRGTTQDFGTDIREPGFEFVEEFDGPPMLYFVLMTGDTSYWQLLDDLFTEVGATVTNGAVNFTLHYTTSEVELNAVWQKSTGILLYYKAVIPMEGPDVVLEFHLIGSEELPPTTTSTTTGAPAIIPGYEIILVLPLFFCLIAINLRRRAD